MTKIHSEAENTKMNSATKSIHYHNFGLFSMTVICSWCGFVDDMRYFIQITRTEGQYTPNWNETQHNKLERFSPTLFSQSHALLFPLICMRYKHSISFCCCILFCILYFVRCFALSTVPATFLYVWLLS